MNLKANGEPLAFPTGCPADRGLTKREYFAAVAMQGLLASDAEGFDDHWSKAEYAVLCADALIAELAVEGAA